MCYIYRNPHGHVCLWCEVKNVKQHGASYLRSFQDMCEDYYDNYNFCPYCGKKLEVNADER